MLVAAELPPDQVRIHQAPQELTQQGAQGKVGGERRIIGIVAVLAIAAPQFLQFCQISLLLLQELMRTPSKSK